MRPSSLPRRLRRQPISFEQEWAPLPRKVLLLRNLLPLASALQFLPAFERSAARLLTTPSFTTLNLARPAVEGLSLSSSRRTRWCLHVGSHDYPLSLCKSRASSGSVHHSLVSLNVHSKSSQTVWSSSMILDRTRYVPLLASMPEGDSSSAIVRRWASAWGPYDPSIFSILSTVYSEGDARRSAPPTESLEPAREKDVPLIPDRLTTWRYLSPLTIWPSTLHAQIGATWSARALGHRQPQK